MWEIRDVRGYCKKSRAFGTLTKIFRLGCLIAVKVSNVFGVIRLKGKADFFIGKVFGMFYIHRALVIVTNSFEKELLSSFTSQVCVSSHCELHP